MNLTRIISIKERIATSSELKPDERDFILKCINTTLRARALRNASSGCIHCDLGSEPDKHGQHHLVGHAENGSIVTLIACKAIVEAK